MSSLFRPSFEVVKEGRILNFLSGYRKIFVSGKRLFMILNIQYPFQGTLKENQNPLEIPLNSLNIISSGLFGSTWDSSRVSMRYMKALIIVA